MRPFRNLTSKDVEPWKRHHSHTRAEWKSFRDDFTRLYQVDRRKLADVVELLREKGFRASEKQCKTYIKKWGLEKNNKQIDMIFAAQNQLKRNGKKTIYKYRGLRRTEADVAHYWSRKKGNFEDFSPVPTTPAGMEYFTPASTPRDTMEGTRSGHHTFTSDEVAVEPFSHGSPLSTSQVPRMIEIFDDPDDAETASSSDAMSVVLDLDVFREYDRLRQVGSPSPSIISAMFLDAARRCIASNYQSTTLELIEAPETFRKREHILNRSKDYFSGCLQEMHLGIREAPASSLDIWRFRNLTFTLLYAIRYNHSKAKDSIEIMFRDVNQMLPALMKHDNPDFILCIMGIIFFVSIGDSDEKLCSQRILRRAIDHAMNMWDHDHPRSKLLVAIVDPETRPLDLMYGLLLVKDLFFGTIEQQRWVVQSLLDLLGTGASYSEPFDLLKIRDEVYNVFLARFQTAKTDASLVGLLNAQARLADAHMDLGNHDEASNLLQDGLGKLRGIQDPKTRSDIWALLQFGVGQLKFFQEKVRESLNAFNEVLSIYLQFYGPLHHRTITTAEWCRFLQVQLHEETQRRLQAGFTIP